MSQSPPPEPADTAASTLTERFRTACDLLEEVGRNRGLLDALDEMARRRFWQAVSHVRGPDSRTRRRLHKALQREARAARPSATDEQRAATGIRALRRKGLFTAPPAYAPTFPEGQFEPRDIHDSEPEPEPATRTVRDACYVCKRPYAVIHHFYDQLCPECADVNFTKRTELADLRGRVALVTGGRVKIGYQAALKLLRCGAHVIVTTRFPRDSAARFAREPEFAEWRDRLEIFGLDLRHTPSVEAFCQSLLGTHTRLDFIVNNACQTVRRPPQFYDHMMARELAASDGLSAQERHLLEGYETLRAGTHADADGGDRGSWLARPGFEMPGLTHAPQLSQVALLQEELLPHDGLFPAGRLDADLQQVDLRGRNSWRLLLHEVSAVELLEVHLVNAVAPFILNARLKPLMMRTSERDKHIVNVSAMEGQFYRSFKTTRHPHTNMAKAALNMMTRTAAADYFSCGIHMNSVDTGWVTDEDPVEIAQRKTTEHGFHPPLDAIDGAARIVDPIIDGINTGRHVWGQFLKDYRQTDW